MGPTECKGHFALAKASESLVGAIAVADDDRVEESVAEQLLRRLGAARGSIWKETASLLTETHSQARLGGLPREVPTRQLVSSAWRGRLVLGQGSPRPAARSGNRFRLSASVPGRDRQALGPTSTRQRGARGGSRHSAATGSVGPRSWSRRRPGATAAPGWPTLPWATTRTRRSGASADGGSRACRPRPRSRRAWIPRRRSAHRCPHRPQTHASGGGLCSSVRFEPGPWVRPWPGAPRCWPRLCSEPGLSCCSPLAASALDSTAPVARSLSTLALPASRSGSATSSRHCARRAFSRDSDLIVWRRDLAEPCGDRRLQRQRFDNVFLTARSPASSASSAFLIARSLAGPAPLSGSVRMVLRRRPLSGSASIVVFWRRDRLKPRAVQPSAAASASPRPPEAWRAGPSTSPSALDTSRAWRSQKPRRTATWRGPCGAQYPHLRWAAGSLDSFIGGLAMRSVLSGLVEARVQPDALSRDHLLVEPRSSVRSDLTVSFWSGEGSRRGAPPVAERATARSRPLGPSMPPGPCAAGRSPCAARPYRRPTRCRPERSISGAPLPPAMRHVPCRGGLLRLFDGLTQPAPAGLEPRLPRIAIAAGGHFRPAQLFRARFGRVRQRPFPLHTVTIPVRAARLRHRHDGQPDPASTSVRLVPKSSSRTHHAHDDSAWQIALPAERQHLVGPRLNGQMLDGTHPRPERTLTVEQYRTP